MDNEQINPQLVIESLSNQIAGLSKDIAILQAVNAQLRMKLDAANNPPQVVAEEQ